ncbi:hypothetical protein [Serratia oryzae]|uniref:hypothetical protein n=1 Tax=Serratia oryzae TaxID=2034155 RepID=UPI0012E24DB9|nr:hypothetical protein [Serratia oryzae]
MTTPAPLNHHCVYDVLNHAMDTINTDAARWSLRSEAEVYRAALLDAIQFIGVAIDSSGLTLNEINKTGGFLMCAPELIRSMDALIDGYEEMQDVNHKGVNHG